MALTYEESAMLSRDGTFRGRVAVACLNFAKYISAEAPSTPAHNTRYRWAQDTFRNPDMIAGQIQATVVQQDQVQADGAAITDPNLQTATEVAIQNFL